MSRPESVTNEDILRWSENIDNDPKVPKFMSEQAILREIMYAGLWFCEELEKLGCNPILIVRLQHAAGGLCFGKPDPWEVHQEVLEAYQNNDIDFEMDYSEDDTDPRAN